MFHNLLGLLGAENHPSIRILDKLYSLYIIIYIIYYISVYLSPYLPTYLPTIHPSLYSLCVQAIEVYNYTAQALDATGE